MNDLEMLRQYEPIIHFTEGEMFFPYSVDDYICQSSLWIRDNEGNIQMAARPGRVTKENLGTYNAPPPNHTYYLQFVDEPLTPLEYQQWWNRPDRPQFRAIGRLARVNLASRLIDSLFDFSLVVRGTVPGGTAAKAHRQYAQMKQKDGRDVYYGRVLREGGYIILHYLFFYVMNNWRTGFYGVNDHEADWEQIFIYLSDEGDQEPIPRWVAYASHDFQGDDLRRRWDDRELKRIGDHPIIYAGAGSHASYFSRGEYLMSVAPAFLRPVARLVEVVQRFWIEQLGQGQQQFAESVKGLLRVPFIDYARGDGIKIGPGQRRTWTPILLTDEDTWVQRYRGLWGLDTRDFIGGERAPGGPKFNRDGSVRQSWSDPLGWSGLDKVPPPRQTAVIIREQLTSLTQKQEQLTHHYRQLRDAVRVLALETAALSQTDYHTPLLQEKLTLLENQEQSLQSLRQEQTELVETKAALSAYLQDIESGDWGDPRAHIIHTHDPEPPLSTSRRLLDVWAALSGGLLVIALLLLFAIPVLRPLWFLGIGLVIVSFILIEAAVQGRLIKFLLNVTVWLALVTAVLLLIRFWLLVTVLALGFFAIVMIRENVREILRI